MKEPTPIKELCEFHKTCHKLIDTVLRDIDAGLFAWRPAPNSRSISEMLHHSIRVDNGFLQQFGLDSPGDDPGETSPQAALTEWVARRHALLALFSRPNLEWTRLLPDHKSVRHGFAEVVLHMAHHYLYHYAQMVYLRRMYDRDWSPALHEWEAANYLAGAQTRAIHALMSQ